LYTLNRKKKKKKMEMESELDSKDNWGRMAQAANRDDVPAIKALVASGISPNVICKGGISALVVAIYGYSPNAITALLDLGADKDLDPQKDPDSTHAPLFAAQAMHNLDAVVILLERGADFHALSHDKDGAALAILRAGCSRISPFGVQLAWSNTWLYPLQLVIDRGASVTEIYEHRSLLEHAMKLGCTNSVLNCILKVPAAREQLRSRQPYFEGPLYLAITQDNIARVELLLAAGANPRPFLPTNWHTFMFYTNAFAEVIHKAKHEFIQLFLVYGANIYDDVSDMMMSYPRLDISPCNAIDRARTLCRNVHSDERERQKATFDKITELVSGFGLRTLCVMKLQAIQSKEDISSLPLHLRDEIQAGRDLASAPPPVSFFPASSRPLKRQKKE
jgi:ankyrin repeat protein